MMNYGFNNWNWGMMNSFNSPAFAFPIFIVAVWSLVWKGMALWKAARKDDRNWFVAILVINTLGILDILYIYFFSKKSSKTKKK